jgi:hypothetical protein
MNFNPDNGIDLAAYLVVGLPAIIAAVAAFRQQNRHFKGQAKIAEQTLYEVKNNHPSNLRDDIDDLGKSIDSGFRELKSDISGLREEIRTERVERIEGDRRARGA